MANLTGVFADIGNLIPSQGDLLNSIIAGAAGTVVLSGLKSQEGQNALDPLHLFHAKDSGTQGAVQGGPVMVASQFSKLDPGTQQALLAAHYTIIPG